jgi:hypothetical protein
MGLRQIRVGYSIFGIGVDRKHTLKWFFPQEKTTFRGSEKVYVYSENALTGTTWQFLVDHAAWSALLNPSCSSSRTVAIKLGIIRL